MREPSLPFERRGGEEQQTAIYNRICAIKRIEFLCGIDLSLETAEFKKLVDSEMYVRFYKDYPADHKIDEEFCQNCALIVKELKANLDIKVLEVGIDERVKELYKESKLRPAIPTELNKISEPVKISLFKRLLNWTSKQ